MNHTITRITDRVFQLRMQVIPNCPTNCFFILGSKYNIIIDTGFGSETASILSNSIDKKKETIVVNTHYHWDHIWGNKYIEKSFSVGHANIFSKIEDDWNFMIEKNKKFICGMCEKENIDISFTERLDIHSDDLSIFYSPGHSDDSISIYYKKDDVLIVGDNIGDNENEICPYLDCSKESYLHTLKQYIEIDAKHVLSGHYENTDSSIFSKIKEILINS